MSFDPKKSTILQDLVTKNIVQSVRRLTCNLDDRQDTTFKMDSFLHQNLQYIRTINESEQFLLDLHQSLERHQISPYKLSAIRYHLVAIQLAKELASSQTFNQGEFVYSINLFLETYSFDDITSKVWILNKVIFYLNSVPKLSRSGQKALKAIETYKSALHHSHTSSPHDVAVVDVSGIDTLPSSKWEMLLSLFGLK